MAKIVHCIRHGQSTFNAVYAPSRGDPLHFDARLSDLGHRQVHDAAEIVSDTAYDLVVTSPLTRALQTTFGAFGEHPARPPIIVEALHRELLANSCDVGRAPHLLREEFPRVAFDHLEEVWWHREGTADARGIHVEPIETLQARVAAFRGWLAARPEKTIAVVGHGTFFFHLTGGHHFANCEIVPLVL